MVSVGQHPFIKLMSYSEVVEVSGFVGNYTVKVRRKARYVDEGKCTGCGLCQTKCPWKTDSEFDIGLGKRKAIYMPFPQAIPLVPVIDKDLCVYFKKGTCRVCEKFCEANALDFEQTDRIEEIEVGSIILATGFETFDARRIPRYSYGRLPNVVTSLELERMVNASGPTGGKIVLEDGLTPERVGIVHCVGSRDVNYNVYCSRVCCMASLKLAHLVREKYGRRGLQLLHRHAGRREGLRGVLPPDHG